MTVQWLGLRAFPRGARVQSLFREPCFHNLHRAPREKKKKFSVSGDPVCNVHWDWATTTALPLGIHCSQNFLSKKVS